MRRPLLIINLIVLIDLMGFGLIIPLLPFYAQEVGASDFMIGMLYSSFSLAALVAGPVLGGLSDRRGRRAVILPTLMINAMGFVVFALGNHFIWLVVARMMSGFAAGNMSVARAYIVDVAQEHERGKAFSRFGASYGIGFVAGPFLAWLMSPLGHKAPLWAAATLSTLACLVAYSWLDEPPHGPLVRAGQSSSLRSLPQMMGRPFFRSLLLVDFFYWAAAASYQVTFALLVQSRFHFDSRKTSFLLAVFGMVGVLAQFFVVPKAIAKLGEHLTMIVGLLLVGVGLQIGALAPTVPIFALAMIPMAFGQSLTLPSLVAMLARNGQPWERGLLQGAASAIENFARILGPGLGTVVFHSLGGGGAYGIAAILMGFNALLATLLQLYPPRKSPAEGSPSLQPGRP